MLAINNVFGYTIGDTMATETESTEPGFNLGRLASGVGGGVLGALLFGLLVELVLTDFTVAMAVPGLYGIEGPLPVAAWGLHLYHGALLGMVYVIAAQYEPFSRFAHSYGGAAILGVAYGVALTVGVAVLVALIGAGIVGFGGLFQLPPITPSIVVATMLGHVLFAIVVAFVHATYVTRYDPETEPGEVVP